MDYDLRLAMTFTKIEMQNRKADSGLVPPRNINDQAKSFYRFWQTKMDKLMLKAFKIPQKPYAISFG